jgi:hypothetical protein
MRFRNISSKPTFGSLSYSWQSLYTGPISGSERFWLALSSWSGLAIEIAISQSRRQPRQIDWPGGHTLDSRPTAPDLRRGTGARMRNSPAAPNLEAQCAASKTPVKSIGRVGIPSTPGPPRPICDAARDARLRNSSAAPNLETQCRAAGGPQAAPASNPPDPSVDSGVHVSSSESAVVISQVYGGGGTSNAAIASNFVELLNRGTDAVSVDGWSIQYASAQGAMAGRAAGRDDSPRSLLLDSAIDWAGRESSAFTRCRGSAHDGRDRREGRLGQRQQGSQWLLPDPDQVSSTSLATAAPIATKAA